MQLKKYEDFSLKEKAFITAYIKNKGNASQAAIDAGYSKKTSRMMGYKLLNKPYIKTEIDKILKAKNDKKIVQADEVIELLSKLARGKVKEDQVVVEGGGNGFSTARIIKKGTANRDQLSALDKLARIHGLYQDRVEITQTDREDNAISGITEALTKRELVNNFGVEEAPEFDEEEDES